MDKVTKCLVLLLVSALAKSTPAEAWTFSPDEDPLTDTKTGVLFDTAGAIGIGFKCWNKGEVQLRFLTPAPWKGQSEYKAVATVDARVDKLETRLLMVIPTDSGGRFSLVTAVDNPAEFEESVLGEFVAQMRDARSRVVFGIGGQIVQVSNEGLKRSVDAFVKQCGLKLPSAESSKSDEIETKKKKP
jgi:hypothetical protein